MLRLIETPAVAKVSKRALFGDVIGPCPHAKCRGVLVLIDTFDYRSDSAGLICDKCGDNPRFPWSKN